MSLEQALKENTEALQANTAAHAALTAVAVKTSTGKSPTESEDDEGKPAAPTAAEKKAAAAAAKRKAATEKKKADEAAAKKEAADEDGDVEIVKEISDVDLRALAKEFMSTDDTEERDARKENFGGALKHLGAAKLSEVSDDQDRVKLANYINHWIADEELAFDEVDAKISGSDDDDMLD